MPDKALADDEFAIEINFSPETINASGIFRCMAGLVDGFASLDDDFAGGLGLVGRTQLILQRVEAGSLRSVFKSVLELFDDDALSQGNWNMLIGRFLLRAKRSAIRELQEPPVVTTEAVSRFRRDVRRMSTEVGFRPGRQLNPAPFGPILDDIETINSSLKLLDTGESASLITAGEPISLKQNPRYSSRRLKRALIQRSEGSEEEMTLPVKRPDYLGGQSWDFVQDGRAQRIKILDHKWLRNFRLGEVSVRPGESLKVLARIDVSYDEEDEVIFKKIQILRVLEIIRARHL
jgi:hypothetical protein